MNVDQMLPVPRLCACGGSLNDLHHHHLYSAKDGCPDDLRVWLCRVCHERTHNRRTRAGLEHQRLHREGVANAKLAGKYKGRKPTARAKTADVLRLKAVGMTREGIAGALHIGVASVYRILADERRSPPT